jgi:hypothetical protein
MHQIQARVFAFPVGFGLKEGVSLEAIRQGMIHIAV